MHDTATDVAMEMVKELEISDWEPLEIAEMIEKEISSLIPNWKGLSQVDHLQHSFSYGDYDDDDENDDGTHHPCCSTSSHSSSQASLLAFNSSFETHSCHGRDATTDHDRFQGIYQVLGLDFR